MKRAGSTTSLANALGPVLALLLAALAATVMPQAALAAPPAGAAAKDAEPDPQATRITGSENYVPTFGLRASIARGYKVHGVLAVDAGLDVPDPKARKRVDAVMPRLMSSMRDAVSNYASLSYTLGDRPDADMLRLRLQKSVDGVLGSGQAKVALASVMVFRN